MLRIVPSRSAISLRSPGLSFLVEVPRDQLFEIACASDPQLFSPAYRGRRTASTFYTSRSDGWMRLRSGSAKYTLPNAALFDLLGAKRIYYVLGAYGGSPVSAMFTTRPREHLSAPFLPVLSDGSPRMLSARRYGARAGGRRLYTWGGDFDRDMDINFDEDEEENRPPPSGPNAPLQPGHVVKIEVRDTTGVVNAISHLYPVEPSGDLRMPRIAPIRARGMLLGALRTAIQEAFTNARVFGGASVNVSLPDDGATVPYSVQLSPNDKIYVRVLQPDGTKREPSGAFTLTGQRGEIDLPGLGVIAAAGKTIESLQAAIIEGWAENAALRTALVHVSATELL